MSFRALIVSAVLLVGGSRPVQLEASALGSCDPAVQTCAALDADTLCLATTDSTGRRPWVAAAEVAGLNAGLLAFDRYVIRGGYAYVTMKTIRRNVEMTHWWWDVDKFRTNMMGHPYHGNLYFNAARSCGMNFWTSALFTTGGSLLWELAGENELPSVNDQLATSLGGVAIGEVTHRLSSMMLDESQTGARRVLTEVAGAVVNPFRAFNRLLTGEAWRVRPGGGGGRADFPFEGSVSVGARRVAGKGQRHGALTAAYAALNLEYGDATEQGHCKPYDYFRAGMTLTAARGQNVVNDVSIAGRLLQLPLKETERMEAALGLYQHFGYYHADTLSSGMLPYKLSEAVGLGPGLTMRLRQLLPSVDFRQAFFANVVPLGGAADDHPGPSSWRDYSFGSGFNMKSSSRLTIGTIGRFWLDVEDHHLYTWLGYDGMESHNRTYAQGHRGHKEVLMVRSAAEVNMRSGWGLRLAASYFYRNNRYAVLPNRKAHAWEWRAGVMWRL